MGAGDGIDAVQLNEPDSLHQFKQPIIRKLCLGRSGEALALKEEPACLGIGDKDWLVQLRAFA